MKESVRVRNTTPSLGPRTPPEGGVVAARVGAEGAGVVGDPFLDWVFGVADGAEVVHLVV